MPAPQMIGASFNGSPALREGRGPKPVHVHYVYLLRSDKDGGFYIGRSEDVERRLDQHNAGLVDSTEVRRPLQLVYYEAYPTKEQADERERKLKAFGSAYVGLLKRLGFH